jgi:hypothetical protein
MFVRMQQAVGEAEAVELPDGIGDALFDDPSISSGSSESMTDARPVIIRAPKSSTPSLGP